MPLVTLQDRPASWSAIKHAADVLWRAPSVQDISLLRSAFQHHFSDPELTVVDLHTGINNSRRGVVMCTKDIITIAFEGCHADDMMKNLWTDVKGPNWWDLPGPAYSPDGNRVHSFFRDMWSGMRKAALEALDDAVRCMVARGTEPKEVIVTGYSMGGGVSILAFTDILEHIRSVHGSRSASPHVWACDANVGSRLCHFTFAAVAAADRGYYTALNQLYGCYQIRAWDFMSCRDITVHAHASWFRSWLGHRYVLPDHLVRRYEGEFGPHGHFMLGHLKVAEWMAGEGTDEILSAYVY